jgi:hypothetical protein
MMKKKKREKAKELETKQEKKSGTQRKNPVFISSGRRYEGRKDCQRIRLF